ncbi:High-affinity branched-chain amino acid transport ATP-binding protein LivF [Bradyrhizobium ivorense]|uniref:High-affinity branched-chain amino acid transport ATP-binding protein LivF n=1 Tax=Bradyrhizobium ivorense TaxID=2511166 RepID=A0A508TBU8_9BRAD|nr:ABC transporter ATP-binding protein [Bradyrhizobium ivorense]VIO72945.1 High-affinity branched-chain amino acid transport ATP-binding protein LivF [Bradyrhizobium ivorense]
MSTLMTVSRLDVRYGQKLAVNQACLDVAAGTITTIIGANGAGKTSLLSGLMGLAARSGSIVFQGRDVSDEPPESKVRRGMILVPERRELFGSMSVQDNLLLGAMAVKATRHSRRDRLDLVYKKYPRLSERRTQQAGTLSGGERQMLALGRALMGNPRLLMLDEPSLGLAPNFVNQMFEWIVGLREEGMSILLIEQNARLALDVAQYAYVMRQGEISPRADAAEMRSREDIAAQYLGPRRKA